MLRGSCGAAMLLCACAMSAAMASDTAVITVSVICAPSPPTGTITINGGAAYATSRTVTLTLSADDGGGSGVTRMRFSNGGSWSDWEPYAPSKTWMLGLGDGPKTVRVEYADAAGNSSEGLISDDITLDTIPPACEKIVGEIETGEGNTRAALFTVSFSEDVVNFDDPGDMVIHTTGGMTYSGISITGGPTVYTVEVLSLDGDGFLTLAVSTASDVEDLAGNVLASSVTSNPVSVFPGVPVLGLAGMAVLLGLIAIAGVTLRRYILSRVVRQK
ncbi:MAG: hypothetical protein NTU83_04705 [Candidatus Hydrogenedentes bacterium]|nr:hypothetical protein [Candidatus Hydrogenedentota bacterium]